jgi:hypothetical protein
LLFNKRKWKSKMNYRQQIAYKLKFGFTYKMPKTVMHRLTLLLACFLLFSVQSKAQLDETDTGSIIKASYIYNFAKLVVWTESKTDPELTICILRDSHLYKQLVKRYAGKKIGNQTVEVKLLLEENDFDGMHILFVPRKQKDHLGKIAGKLAGKNTLLISESDGALAKGSVINFITVNNNLKFEISEENGAAHKLIIGSTLVSLAEK